MDEKCMDKEEGLMRIERSLWTNDAAIYEATYSRGAIFIFPGVGRIGLEHALEAIRTENAAGRHWAEVGFAGIFVTRIAPHVELLTRREEPGADALRDIGRAARRYVARAIPPADKRLTRESGNMES
jgi:hypothetical protein